MKSIHVEFEGPWVIACSDHLALIMLMYICKKFYDKDLHWNSKLFYAEKILENLLETHHFDIVEKK